MINRRTLLLDRLATLALALVLVVLGVLGAWWWTNPGQLPARSSTDSVAQVVAMHWFPWASAAAGGVLVYLGIRWMGAHLSRSGVNELRLEGSGTDGTLVVDAGTIAAATAVAFSDTLGVRNAKGAITRDRGQLLAKITATIDPHADLADVASQADRVSAQLRQVLGRDDLHCRVELRVARSTRHQPRVS